MLRRSSYRRFAGKLSRLRPIAVCLLWLTAPVLPCFGAPEARFQPGEVIVKLRPGVHSTEAASVRATLNATVERRFPSIGAELWKISGVTVDQAVAAYQNDPRVLYIEPNYRVRALQSLPNDPLFSKLWGLHNTGQTGGTPDADIDAPEAWSIHTGTNVVVAVIDTGVDWSHQDLANNMWINSGEIQNNGIDDDNNGFVDDVRGWDFYNKDGNPMDDHGHGTHVSGTIAARGNNGVGVTGVAWSARIMALKFLDGGGSGSFADAISALEYATKMGARITSNSWGGNEFSQALYDAIKASQGAGMLFIAAAGNDNADNELRGHYPSNYDLDAIIAVAATDHRDGKASFSNYGNRSVDLGAPGADILSTVPGNRYVALNGTSMATPHVAGACALLWSLQPSLTAAQVKAQILGSVDAIPALAGRTVTGGRLNVRNALNTLNPPSVNISTPADGESFAQGTSVRFTGSASDPHDGDLTSALVWTSSRDGKIGGGGSFSTTTLSVGTHTIVSTVTNQGGLSASDSLSIQIVRSNGAPAVSIAAPVDGSSFGLGVAIGFSGSAADAEDGDLTSRLAWSSSLDGPLGSGGAFSRSNLSAGKHTITASVRDGGGLLGSASVSIQVGGLPPGVVDFNRTLTVPYSDQDHPQSGSITVEDNGGTLVLTGNRWRRTAETFKVTPFTVLEFDFQSTSEGEIHGIGFDEDDNVSNNKRVFQIFGTQTWESAVQVPDRYRPEQLGQFVHFSIRVGEFYTGSGLRLVFVNDKDLGPPTNTSRFRNVRIREDVPAPTPLDFNVVTTKAYDNQDGVGSIAVEDQGRTLFMQGNRWRTTEKTFIVTPSTKLVLEFMSTAQGEIQGIGFDEDGAYATDRRIFRIFGTQSWAGLVFWTNPSPYLPADVGKWKSIEIPVGQFYTGTAMRLVFVNDDDRSSPASTSRFRNVRVVYQ